MHVSAFYASSVQLGTHPHMWLHCVYTRELALTCVCIYIYIYIYICVYIYHQEKSSDGKQFLKRVSCFYAQGGNVGVLSLK